MVLSYSKYVERFSRSEKVGQGNLRLAPSFVPNYGLDDKLRQGIEGSHLIPRVFYLTRNLDGEVGHSKMLSLCTPREV